MASRPVPSVIGAPIVAVAAKLAAQKSVLTNPPARWERFSSVSAGPVLSSNSGDLCRCALWLKAKSLG